MPEYFPINTNFDMVFRIFYTKKPWKAYVEHHKVVPRHMCLHAIGYNCYKRQWCTRHLLMPVSEQPPTNLTYSPLTSQTTAITLRQESPVRTVSRSARPHPHDTARGGGADLVQPSELWPSSVVRLSDRSREPRRLTSGQSPPERPHTLQW